jgi:DNA topoisomerase-1
MESAELERTIVDIDSKVGPRRLDLRATGQVVLFDGFLKLYQEGRDDEADDDESRRLPPMKQGDSLDRRAIEASQHFTEPPPRYSEASLVKRMEELGIGRPSTYASIVSTIQDRDYVAKDKGRLIPQDKGRLVTAFLSNYFRRYVDYDFTADLEEDLDRVSAGEAAWKDLLGRFWRDFSAAVAETADLRIGEVLEKIDEVLAPHLYPARADGGDPRQCQTCGTGRLSMRTSRTGGAFIGCSNYPDCRYTRPFGPPGEDGEATGDRVLGEIDGLPVTLRDGRFGPYVQKGEATESTPKPPRASLPKGWSREAMDLEKARQLLSLPRPIGPHPEDGALIEAGIGRFGPYIKHGSTYANLREVDEVFIIGMNRAVEVLAQKKAGGPRRGGGTAAQPLKTLGEHPEGGVIAVMPGRYGPYVKWEKVNATIPKDLSPEDLNIDQALELIAAKAGGARKTATPRKAAAKAPAKAKTAAKKPAKVAKGKAT